jgi:protein-disulfide isomerase
VAGNPVGDVTLVEFFDYHCAYCKRALNAVTAVLGEDPGLRIVYKEFPILGPDSVLAARAALASRNQDPSKYLEFHVALMSTRGRLTQPRILEIARDAGFDAERLVADMASPEINTAIERNIELARSLEINGTPTFVIGDQLVPGAVDLDTLRRLIAEARAS